MTVVRSGAASDVGRVRQRNEDRALEGPDLFAVADGMGGHAGGEVASKMAMEALQAAFAGHRTPSGLREAVNAANAAVWRRAYVRAELRGMGTTLTAAALVTGEDGRDVMVLANVGDSRAYVYSDHQMAQVTADHSLAEEKVRQGELTEAEAAVHPYRHILTRALGVGPEVEIDLWELQVHAGDRVLLCSDGLTNELDDDEIAQVLDSVADPGEAARKLVTAANDHGGSDNITVVVVDVLVADPLPADGNGDVSTLDGADRAQAAGPLVAAAPVAADGAPSVGPAGEAPLDHDAEADRDGRSGPASEAGAEPSSPAARATEDVTGVVLAVPSPTTTLDGAASDLGLVERQHEDEPGARGWWARRRERRRRRRAAGIPRRLTLRVVLFLVLVAGVFVGAYYFIRWYANDNWYVTVQKNELVIYQGRPGGLLWFQPHMVDRTGMTTSDILPSRVAALQADVQEGSLGSARRYVTNLVNEKQDQQQVNSGLPLQTTTTSTTTTVPPPAPAPSTTAPVP